MEIDGNIYPIAKVQSWLAGEEGLKCFLGRELTLRWRLSKKSKCAFL
jgi:hypothetical protein